MQNCTCHRLPQDQRIDGQLGQELSGAQDTLAFGFLCMISKQAASCHQKEPEESPAYTEHLLEVTGCLQKVSQAELFSWIHHLATTAF